jgi:hypothetical protein
MEYDTEYDTLLTGRPPCRVGSGAVLPYNHQGDPRSTQGHEEEYSGIHPFVVVSGNAPFPPKVLHFLSLQRRYDQRYNK